MEDQEMKFVCKWCNKRYPCGKSLGGHIRTHMMINHRETDESQEKSDAHLKKMSFLNGEKSSCELGGQTSYGLRENPKKTIKAVETITSSYPMPNEKICRQCGKGFQSMKALCGHMAVHSEKDKGLKDDQSWTSEEENDEKTVMEEDTDSDTESEERKLIRSKTMEKRYNNNKSRIMINSLGINNDSSSVSEIDEQEQEHVAMCLMMLSQDSSNWGGVMNSVVESSDNNSVVLETKSSSNEMRIISRQHVPKDAQVEINAETKKEDSYKKLDLSQDVEEENSDSGYYLNEYVKDESDGSVDGFHRIASFFESKKRPKVSVQDKHMNKVLNEPCRKVKMKGSPDAADEHPKSAQKKRKYECLNCKKIFNSFQALGGHRPCHKRSNNAINESNNYESEENSLEVENDPYKYDSRKLAESPPTKRKANAKVDKTINSKKTKTHECPYCHRIFKNGQALGGHKRSHFIGGNYVQNRYDQAPVYKEEHPELLDLNLPAPTEDEDGGDFVSCWKVGGTSRMD